jgi:two-component system, sensor histidine kinase
MHYPTSLSPTATQLWRLAQACCIGAAGYILNLFPFHLSDSISFYFGRTAQMFSAVTLGPLYAAITAVLGAAGTYQDANAAGTLGVAAVEAAMVGYLVRFWNLHLLSAAIVSQTVPAAAVLFSGIGQTSATTWIVFGQGAVSAVLGAAVLQWIFSAAGLTRRTSKPVGIQRTFRGQLYEGFTTLATTMVLILMLLFTRMITVKRTDEVAFRLSVAARTVGTAVAEYLSDHEKAIGLLAETLAETGAAWDAPRLRFWLRQFHNKYPSLLFVQTTNSRGNVVVRHPWSVPDGRQVAPTSLNVSDSSYFQQTKRTERPWVSDVFVGPGERIRPLVAVSAPIWNDAGGFSGVVEGSLNLSQMGNFERYSPGVEVAGIVIVDKAQRVVFAGGRTPYRLLDDLSDSELVRAAKAAGTETVIRYSRPSAGTEDPEGQGWFLAGYSTVPEYGWSVFVEAPADLVLRELLGIYSRLAAWTCVGVALCFLLSRVVASRYVRPLEQLVGRMSQLRPSGGLGERLKADQDVPVEVARLIESFCDLSSRLAAADAARRATLAHLEEEVRSRTAELEEARARAERGSRAKGVFLATMSHEIRTPMNGVLGTLRLLDGTPLETEQREYTQLALQSAESLLGLLNDSLDLSKIEAGRLTLDSSDFDIVQWLETSTAPFRVEARLKGLTIKTCWAASPSVLVCGDAGRLRQVLTNLVGNAVKFTPSGGILVQASWRREPWADQRIRLEMTVTDSGIGISKQACNHLFEPFIQGDVTTTSQYGGTGLGLAISKQLVEMMDGGIEFESDLGKGSTFRFWVMLSAAQGAVSRSEARVGSSEDSAEMLVGRKVLLVEDNSVSRLVANRLLLKMGCTIVEATTGVEALAAWQREEFDVVLMDCQMPVMDGYEATREIRRLEKGKPRSPIIALTANAMSGDPEKCLTVGMDDFIPKPVHPAELARVVARVLKHFDGSTKQRFAASLSTPA